jgi:hypothetical protein
MTKQSNNFKMDLTPVYEVLTTAPDLTAVKDHPHFMLFEMLTYMRPHNSEHELLWCEKYIVPVAPYQDAIGNYHRIIPNVDGTQPRVLFSAHTDTVHRDSGFQNLEYNAEINELRVQKSNCLGTDDATGVYLMLKMIEASVPGYYIFHRGEERGCIGSTWLATNTPEVLTGIDIAVAFDRKGVTDVITHQMTGKCASDKCATQLADQLNLHSGGQLQMKPSPDGVYTDTAEYNHLVPECFNLAVGYYSQHTSNESQDLTFLDHFLKACLNTQWHELGVHRSVTEVDDYGRSPRGGNGYYGASHDSYLYLMHHYPAQFASYLEDAALLDEDEVEELLIEFEDGEYYSKPVNHKTPDWYADDDSAFADHGDYNDDGFTLNSESFEADFSYMDDEIVASGPTAAAVKAKKGKNILADYFDVGDSWADKHIAEDNKG